MTGGTIAVEGRDLSAAVAVTLGDGNGGESVLGTPEDAEEFFSNAPTGYSPDRTGARLEAVQLRASSWHLEPLTVESLHSTFIDEQCRDDGDMAFDSAFLMRNLQATWERIDHGTDVDVTPSRYSLRHAG